MLGLNLEFPIPQNKWPPFGAIVFVFERIAAVVAAATRIQLQSGDWFSPVGGLCDFHLVTLSAMIFIDVIAA